MAGKLLTKDFLSKKQNRGKHRTVPEILLLEQTGRVKTSKTFKHMLCGWNIGKKKLYFERSNKAMNSELRIESVIRTAADFLITWVQQSSPDGAQIHDPRLWKWENASEGDEPTSWQRTNSEWKKTIRESYPLRQRMNASWGVNWDTRKWEELWKKLWQAKIYPRDKLWLWRILNKGFCTQERAATFGVADARCRRCNDGTENVEHLFLCCRSANTNWRTLISLYTRVTGQEGKITSLVEIGEQIVQLEHHTVAILFVTHSRFTWKDRCKQCYEGKTTVTPIHVILQKATEEGLRCRTRGPPLYPPDMANMGEESRTDRRNAMEGRRPIELLNVAATRMAEMDERSSVHGSEEELGSQPEIEERRHDMISELAVLGFSEIPLAGLV
ncbi:hypothetical protein R1sor_020225 [Riccia sorocarpa]|uniref:Reverse transcriptase zinc-binding domain-containing protein n=1 Tax=Riccia sorocarpa TaxID=122646 RepID=A0ABD3IEP9_9MARC